METENLYSNLINSLVNFSFTDYWMIYNARIKLRKKTYDKNE